MPTSVLYVALRCLFQLALLRCRSAEFKELEIIVLRQEIEILRRQRGRPPLPPEDRVFLTAASRLLPRERWGAFLLTPETLLRWRRRIPRRVEGAAFAT